MSRMVMVIGICAWLACAPATSAQTPAVVVVAQGDTVVWVVSPQAGAFTHRVRFGSGEATSVDAAKAIFETLALNADGDSTEGGAKAVLLTAKVKQDAKPGATFRFTCGVHPGAMLSLPIRVEARPANQAERTHTIVAGPVLNWHLHADTTK